MSNQYKSAWSKVAYDTVDTVGTIGEIAGTALGFLTGSLLGPEFGVLGAEAGRRTGQYFGNIARMGAYDLTHENPKYFLDDDYASEVWGQLFLDTFDGFGQSIVNTSAQAAQDTVQSSLSKRRYDSYSDSSESKRLYV